MKMLSGPPSQLRSLATLLLFLLLAINEIHSGILGLTKFFRTNYKNAWTTLNTKEPLEASHVAIEMNQILHTNMRVARDPKHFISKIYCSLDGLLDVVKPTESLVLVFDGPAPFAKMQTQRSRRRSSPDNSLLTPGTYFMDTMQDVVLCYVLQRLNKPLFRNLTVYVSSARDAGEGELKIVNWVSTMMPCKDDSLVICGSDSDLILQAISFPSVGNLTILQNGPVDMFCNISRLIHEIKTDLGYKRYRMDITEQNRRFLEQPFYIRSKEQHMDNKAAHLDFIWLFLMQVLIVAIHDLLLYHLINDPMVLLSAINGPMILLSAIYDSVSPAGK
jgi:5'-3' exonuclease